MNDHRLVGTNPEDGSLVPIAVDAAGLLKTKIGKIESIPNDVAVQGKITATTGQFNGNVYVSGTLFDSDNQPISGGNSGGIELPPDPQEGDLLGWQDGQLAWISTVEPEPSVIFTGNINPTPNGSRKVVNANGGNDTGTITDYDAWFRSQSFFPDTATANKGFGTTGGNNTDWWEMDILNATGMILTVTYWYRFASESNGARFSWNCVPDSSHIVQISGALDNISMNATGGIVFREGTTQFTYLINRPELLNVRFSMQSTIGAAKPADTRAYMAGYKIESSDQYLLRQMAEFRSQLEAVTTTDIDVLRTTCD